MSVYQPTIFLIQRVLKVFCEEGVPVNLSRASRKAQLNFLTTKKIIMYLEERGCLKRLRSFNKSNNVLMRSAIYYVVTDKGDLLFGHLESVLKILKRSER